MHSWLRYCSLQIAEYDVLFLLFVFNSLFLNHGTNKQYLRVYMYMKALPSAPNFLPSIYAVAGVRGEQTPSVTVPGYKGSQLQWLCHQHPWDSPAGEQDTHPQQKTCHKMLHFLGPKTDFLN